MLSDILVLDNKVLIYSTFIANHGNVLVINTFEVLVLVYLYKGNTSVISVDNSFIELEVVVKGETLMFLGQKPSLL
jgi:hypothetical protein